MARGALFLFVLIGLLVYAAGASAVDLSEVIRAAMGLDVGTWVIVLGLSVVNYGVRFGRWQTYLKDLGHRMPVGRHLAIYLSGFAFTPTPAKIGEGIRALYLKPFGVGIGRSLSILYAERLLDIVAVSFLGAFLYFAPVSGFRWLALVGGAIALILLAAQQRPILTLTQRLVDLMPNGRLQRLGARATAFQRDVTSLVRPSLLMFGLTTGLIAWAAEGIGLYLVANALGVDLGPAAAIGIYATAMLAGALSFIPGGLGSTEAMMVVLLTAAGAPLPVAIAVTGLVRLATLWFAIAIGVAAWLGLEASRRPVPR